MRWRRASLRPSGLALALAAVLLAAAGAPGAAAPRLQDVGPAFSPSGSLLAFARWTGGFGRVYVIRPDGSGLRAITPRQAQPFGIAWAPDGSALAYSSAGDIWRADLATDHVRNLTRTPEYDFQAAWSPDGSRIAYTTFEGCFRCTSIRAIAPDGTSATVLVPGFPNQNAFPWGNRRPSWSPDGSQFVSSSGEVRGREGGDPRNLPPGIYYVWGPRRLVAFARGASLRVTDPSRGDDRLIMSRPGRLVGYPSWSRDGRMVAFGLSGGLAIAKLDGTWWRVAGADLYGEPASWSPTGTLAFVERGRCGIDVVDPLHRAQRRRLTRAC